MSRWRRLRRILGYAFGAVVLLIITAWWYWHLDTPDPFPNYELNLRRSSKGETPLRAGAAKIDITPDLPESWTDRDGDAKFSIEAGDTFGDADGDGEFDAVWIAGFDVGRPAVSVHDKLWARACVVESGDVRVGFVSLDLVGLFHSSVLRIREALSKEQDSGRPLVDYLVVASTHNHEGPDTMGLWGPDEWTSGVDREYVRRVEDAVAKAIQESVRSLETATLQVRSSQYGDGVVVHDYKRRPFVIDDTLGVLHFERSNGEGIATVVHWSCHPETLGDENLAISSDFPHWLREGVERGVPKGSNGSPPRDGRGGICLFLNGAIGGMITSLAMDLPDFESGAVISKSTKSGPGLPWSRPRSVGLHVAAEVLRRLDSEGPSFERLPLRVRARTFHVGIANPIFRLAGKLGRLDRGTFNGHLRSEVAIVDLGPGSSRDDSWRALSGSRPRQSREPGGS